MTTIPFVLVTGFLGSGKTTLLKRMLEQYADSRRLAVVQNEFAPASVDGAELRLTGKRFDILEINRGSVFCVCLLSDFVRSLAQMVERVSPDAVILEATGLADPIAVAQLLRAAELRERLYLSSVWCVVDATTFLTIEKAVTRVSHQVRVADRIIVNKTDCSSADLTAVEARLRELNPFASVERATYCQVALGHAFDVPEADPVAVTRMDENAAFESCGRPAVGSAVVRSTRRITQANLERFLKLNAPGSYRLKGFVNLDNGTAVVVQSCFGAIEVRSVDYRDRPTELVAMGPGVDAEDFASSFERLAGG
jgi:G3E family GTPase